MTNSPKKKNSEPVSDDILSDPVDKKTVETSTMLIASPKKSVTKEDLSPIVKSKVLEDSFEITESSDDENLDSLELNEEDSAALDDLIAKTRALLEDIALDRAKMTKLDAMLELDSVSFAESEAIAESTDQILAKLQIANERGFFKDAEDEGARQDEQIKLLTSRWTAVLDYMDDFKLLMESNDNSL